MMNNLVFLATGFRVYRLEDLSFIEYFVLVRTSSNEVGLPVDSRDLHRVTVSNVDAMTWVAKPRLCELKLRDS